MENKKKHNTFNYRNLNLHNLHNHRFIDKDDRIITDYLEETTKFCQLTYEEEQDIICRIKNGDKDADKLKNTLIGSHQPFVIMFAKRHCPYNSGIFLDLVQEGNYGMLLALENYKADSKVKFVSYANSWILKYMYIFLANNNLLKMNNAQKIFGVEARARENFMKQNGYEPTSEELLIILAEMGVVLKCKDDVEHPEIISIDHPVNNVDDDEADDDDLYIQLEADVHIEDDIDKELNKKNVNKAMEILTDMERKVLRYAFGFENGVDCDWATISKNLNIDVSDVKRLYKRGLNKLRGHKELFE